jgi:hypothetical protein
MGKVCRLTAGGVAARRSHGVEQPIAILSPGEKASVKVIRFDPFEQSHQAQSIKVRMYLRTATRRKFSRSSVASKISVQDIKDLATAVDRKQPRLFVV